MAKLLDLTDDGKVWKVFRIRQINGKKIILDKDYFKSEFVSNLSKEILRIRFMDISKRNSGSRLVFQIRKLPWSHAVKKINNYWTLKT
ncbi:UTRA domain-containing protein [[Brevibacterium] frigoritolerans]|uniref:UTRA domain-containing protein n=1 Tax=Peribacillus frigoritolerans TaxID=450367 RepID=A0A941J7C0_9BACI|nr:UTRA domain-containing protein [Peribacillus frigoritolerans]